MKSLRANMMTSGSFLRRSKMLQIENKLIKLKQGDKMEKINLNNKFAVKVGKLWVDASYSNYELTEEWRNLYDLKTALKVQENVGGTIYAFPLVELDDKKLEELKTELSKTAQSEE